MNEKNRGHRKTIGAAGLLIMLLVSSAGAEETMKTCFKASSEDDSSKAVKICTAVLSQRGMTGARRAIVLGNRGLAYFKSDDLDRALTDLNHALDIDPRYIFAYDNRGDVWRKRGDLARAIADYTKALQIDPGFTTSYLGRGRAYEALNDMVKARDDYVAARSQTGTRPIDEWARGEAKAQLERLDAAKK
jgi:Tfp pilus assembly protein PilF